MKNRLRVLRAERTWTQAELAGRVGVSRQTINAIETGKYEPSLGLAFKLAHLFGLAVGSLNWRRRCCRRWIRAEGAFQSSDGETTTRKSEPTRLLYRSGKRGARYYEYCSTSCPAKRSFGTRAPARARSRLPPALSVG